MHLTDILGEVWEVDCLGCALSDGSMTPPGGLTRQNASFYLHQGPEIPIPGYLILDSRRHIQSTSQLTASEQVDLGNLLVTSRKLQETLPEIESVTLIQEERSGHFHLWLFPWYPWMVEAYGSVSLEHIRTITRRAPPPEDPSEILATVDKLRNTANIKSAETV